MSELETGISASPGLGLLRVADSAAQPLSDRLAAQERELIESLRDPALL